MKILFAATAAESFADLPAAAKKKATKSIELLQQHPSIYPVRRRGLTGGYRYCVADGYLFYYSLSALEVRITAIIPGVMLLALMTVTKSKLWSAIVEVVQ